VKPLTTFGGVLSRRSPSADPRRRISFFVCRAGTFYSSTQAWRLLKRRGAAAAGVGHDRREL
jgi:hypothetical protein